MAGFLGIERITLGPWAALERAIQRLLVHAGFDDVRLVGGTGDAGADVVATLNGHIWAVQVKYRFESQTVGAEAVNEVVQAAGRYDAQFGVVATNSGFNDDAVELAHKLSSTTGVRVKLWNGAKLLQRFRALQKAARSRDELRPYQERALEAIYSSVLQGSDRALLLMATGLGKTRIAAAVIERWLFDHPDDQVLVIAPSLALVTQLEAALWPYLPKDIPTHVLSGTEKPAFEVGVTIATEQSALRVAAEHQGRFGLVVVDEAHHAPADGFRTLLDHLSPAFLLGMTATPWRSDERHLEDIFGRPTFSMDIVEGMQLGYLADVDYRMLVDNIDWNWVRKTLRGTMTIKELNRRLFIPERDDAVVDKLLQHFKTVPQLRAILFCRSIEHAESVTGRLRAQGLVARVIHSKLDRFEVTTVLRSFRYGDIPILVAIDMLNEGIDIPDVNMIAFLRVTHSRRIFVQQLGRGLRLREGKSSVKVLDFVSDVRRIASALEINRRAAALQSESSDSVTLRYPEGQIVSFEDDEALQFFREYVGDIAELEDGSDDSKLRFPADERF